MLPKLSCASSGASPCAVAAAVAELGSGLALLPLHPAADYGDPASASCQISWASRVSTFAWGLAVAGAAAEAFD